ncbi:PREDICTED: sialic acid-binding Ig-like lectin 14 [Propithecus coquereli]|uniref:sialic acid-binding Ig-like lectin 14 n=1 Tax=Propithecus coquereli TaxID=379532 RepID=UPI00063F21B0|nr:PREDICTED: sialic acid-binding Ig-like lectin 14 [Propithecus coquereli]
MLALLLLPLLWAGSPQDTGLELQVEKSVTVQEGLCVLVPCSFSYPPPWYPSDPVYRSWFRDGDNIYYGNAVATDNPNRAVKPHTKGRFLLLGDATTRNCSLSIRDAKTKDTGTYLFRVESGYSVKHSYEDNKLNLRVTALTQKPDIHSGRATSYTSMLPFTLVPQDLRSSLTVQVPFPGAETTTEKTALLSTACESVTWQNFSALMRQGLLAGEWISHQTPESTVFSLGQGSSSDPFSSPSPFVVCVELLVLPAKSALRLAPVLSVPAPELRAQLCLAGEQPRALAASAQPLPSDGLTGPPARVIALHPRHPSAVLPTWPCLSACGPARGGTDPAAPLTLPCVPRTVARILSNGTSLPVLEGQSLRLICVADSNPPARLSWSREGKTLHPPQASAPGVLELSGVAAGDGGEFTCRARHPLGSQHLSLSLSVQRSPSGCRCVTEEQQGSRALVITLIRGALMGAGFLLTYGLTWIYYTRLAELPLSREAQ